jgi:acetoin utilization deacetylase AcuC-like enzyme
MKIIYAPQCTTYRFPDHPESPERISKTVELLTQLNYEFIAPQPATFQDVLAVHDAALIAQVKDNQFLDKDTPNNPTMFDHALLAAGAATLAMEYALKNETAFSLMRPPGHHAMPARTMGFCYFNNIAIATKKALNTVNKVALLDIDCHHGNGTEEIARDLHNVLYVSLHAHPCYPETGAQSHGNCLNYPLPPFTQESAYLATLEQALAKIQEFAPELLAVSAGFDTYKEDPVTEFGLEITTFAKIAAMITSLHAPTFHVLEGGYSSALPECIANYLNHCG